MKKRNGIWVELTDYPELQKFIEVGAAGHGLKRAQYIRHLIAMAWERAEKRSAARADRSARLPNNRGGF